MGNVFAWTLIGVGLIGGLVAPFLVRAKTKPIVTHTIGWILWFLFAFVVSQFVMAFAAMAVGRDIATRVEFSVLYQAVTYLFSLAMMALLPLRLWKDSQKSKKSSLKKVERHQFIRKLISLDRRPTWNDAKEYLMSFPLFFVTNLAASAVLTLLLGATVMGQEQEIGFTKTGQEPLSLVLIFFCLVVLAPVFEEMLLRGALFSKIREKLKFWPTALLTAGVFALIHGQFNVGVMTFILALYSAFLREKTGALWSSIMLHATQNLIAFCLLFLVR